MDDYYAPLRKALELAKAAETNIELTPPQLELLLEINMQLLEALQAINEWCGTDDGHQAMPFEPPWYEQALIAITAATGTDDA